MLGIHERAEPTARKAAKNTKDTKDTKEDGAAGDSAGRPASQAGQHGRSRIDRRTARPFWCGSSIGPTPAVHAASRRPPNPPATQQRLLCGLCGLCVPRRVLGRSV